ncbi:MAG: hypothetical protein HRF48_15565 [Chloroflexota bacterium]|jgi:hypothetical protein
MCRKLPLAARAYCWALGIGCALLLVALLTLAHAGRAADRAPAQESYARVLDAVTRLGGCPTCHTAPASQESGAARAVPVSTPVHQAIELPDARPAAAETQTAQVNERLVAVGQRLLDALPSGDARAEQAAEDYLAVVEDVSADNSPAALLTALERLEQLEGILRVLEREARATAFWRASEPSAASAGAATVALTSAPPVAVLTGVGFVLLAAAGAGGLRASGTAESVPAQVAFAFSRRGPPATTALPDSVQREDCRL